MSEDTKPDEGVSFPPSRIVIIGGRLSCNAAVIGLLDALVAATGMTEQELIAEAEKVAPMEVGTLERLKIMESPLPIVHMPKQKAQWKRETKGRKR